MSESEIDSDRFRKVLGRYPTGVTVVTAHDGDDPLAMVIGSFVSVSLDPPLVGFLPGKSSGTWPRMESAGSFCVNVLGDHQLDVANHFFRKDVDPWETVEWHAGATGAPVIGGCIAHIDCTLHEVVDAGDHWMVLGLVREMDCPDEAPGPLLFYGGGYGGYTEL